MIEVAEDLCSIPSKCLTTLLVDDSSAVMPKLTEPKYAKYQVNILMIPMKSFRKTIVIPVYCPFFATKVQIANAWNPVKNSLLFQNTKTECGHPLFGNNNIVKILLITHKNYLKGLLTNFEYITFFCVLIKETFSMKGPSEKNNSDSN